VTASFKEYFDSDFLRIRDFLSWSMSADGGSTEPVRQPWNWMIDRWNFTSTVSVAMHATTHEQWARRIGIWSDGPGGQVVGLVLTEGEGRGEAFIQTGREELADAILHEMFDFIEERFPEGGGPSASAGERPDFVCLRLDPRFPRREEIACRRGFTREGGTEALAWLPASAAPCAELRTGYRLAQACEIRVADKARLHARAFGYADKGNGWIEAAIRAFTRLRLAPDYRPELDLIAMDQRGTPASMVGLWYDPACSWGILEPAGTAPDHGRRGLGRALVGEGMKRLAAAASSAGRGFDGLWVGSDQAFYLNVGFQILHRWGIWRKEWRR
jgi:predicted N-acetyltransferase YhbS